MVQWLARYIGYSYYKLLNLLLFLNKKKVCARTVGEWGVSTVSMLWVYTIAGELKVVCTILAKLCGNYYS